MVDNMTLRVDRIVRLKQNQEPGLRASLGPLPYWWAGLFVFKLSRSPAPSV